MSRDPLCEVGCPYAVRGFDYDYIGVIWGNDLVWRTDRWVVQPGHVHETGISLTTGAARKASAGSAARETLRTKVMQAYRILLTRAIRGVYVWCSDEETRAHLATELGR